MASSWHDGARKEGLADRVGSSVVAPQPAGAALHCWFAGLDFHRLPAAYESHLKSVRGAFISIRLDKVAINNNSHRMLKERSGG